MNTLPSQAKVPSALENIKAHIHQSGPISFHTFMDLALYAQGGYYQRTDDILGSKGDFITAPMMTPLFGQTMAQQIIEIAQTLGDDISIMELGPGTGLMAQDILRELKKNNIQLKNYILVETSRSLTKTQQQKLKDFDECLWYDAIPNKPFKGVILANEFFDALPVHRVQFNDQNQEWYVTLENDALKFTLGSVSSDAVKEKMADLQNTLPASLPLPYDTEVNLEQEKHLKSCFDTLEQGVMLFIDYGFDQAQYYHPSRMMGTLMGHFQHQTTQTPLEKVGQQDLTAHVDFTALTKKAHDMGLNLLGYTSQAHFLLGLGILNFAQDIPFAQKSALNTLLAPQEMGELIKVIAFGKDYENPLKGFSLKDFSYLL